MLSLQQLMLVLLLLLQLLLSVQLLLLLQLLLGLVQLVLLLMQAALVVRVLLLGVLLLLLKYQQLRLLLLHALQQRLVRRLRIARETQNQHYGIAGHEYHPKEKNWDPMLWVHCMMGSRRKWAKLNGHCTVYTHARCVDSNPSCGIIASGDKALKRIVPKYKR